MAESFLTILFTDLVGSASLFDRHGDEAADAIAMSRFPARESEAVIEAIISVPLPFVKRWSLRQASAEARVASSPVGMNRRARLHPRE